MFIKQFRSTWVRVPDPMRPGRRTSEERLVPTGATSISHASGKFDADDDGWFDVPGDVAAELVGFRGTSGERFYSPAEVNEEVRVPEAKRRGRPPKSHDDAD